MANHEKFGSVVGGEFTLGDNAEKRGLGRLALLVYERGDDGVETGSMGLSGEALVNYKEEYDRLRKKYDEICNRFGIASYYKWEQIEALFKAYQSRFSDPESAKNLFDELRETRKEMQELDRRIKLSIVSYIPGEESVEGAKWLEETSSILENMELSKKDDGTCSARLIVEKYNSDCSGYWITVYEYNITFNPGGEVLDAKVETYER